MWELLEQGAVGDSRGMTAPSALATWSPWDPEVESGRRPHAVRRLSPDRPGAVVHGRGAGQRVSAVVHDRADSGVDKTSSIILGFGDRRVAQFLVTQKGPGSSTTSGSSASSFIAPARTQLRAVRHRGSERDPAGLPEPDDHGRMQRDTYNDAGARARGVRWSDPEGLTAGLQARLRVLRGVDAVGSYTRGLELGTLSAY